MALPPSGTITMGQVRTELKKTGSLNLDNADVRKIAVKPTGTIKMSDLYGKTGWVESVTFNIETTLKNDRDEVAKSFSFQLGLNQRKVNIRLRLEIITQPSTGNGKDQYQTRFYAYVSGLGNNERVEIFYKFGESDKRKTVGNCDEYRLENYGLVNYKMPAYINNVKFFIQQ